MNSFRTKASFQYRYLLYKVLLFVGIVALIVYFLPRDENFNYQFDINKPWKYGQLIATFNFPIYKEKAVVKHEQDSILASFQPYYQINDTVEKKALHKLKDDAPTLLKSKAIPALQYIHYIQSKLKTVYGTGIISAEDMVKLQQDSTQSIMVINNKIVRAISTGELYSVKEAYEAILSSDTAQYSKNILRKSALNEYIYPNISFDRKRTETARKEALENYSWANGVVQIGQKIIDRGEIIDQKTYNILESLKKESIKRNETIGQRQLVLAGQILFIGILMLCFMLYLELFRKDYYQHKGNLPLLFSLVIFYCITTSLMVSNNIFNIYIIPYAMLPVIVRVFLDSRTAFITHTITILACSIALHYPYEFILLQLTSGLVAIYSLRELSQRSQLFRTAFLVILTYVLLYFSLELITESSLSKLNGSTYIYFIINGAFLLFTYPLLFLLEKTFNFTSNVTLVELSNINNSLLRKLSETVPGTFQHSLQVASLAAEAAIRVGAKSQLVRTGALYHDIGKMENPAFFTENQIAGVNPHEKLTYEQSAQIVINHVSDGLRLAEKNNLPEAIKDFIVTHHGKGKTKFFYISWKNEHPGKEPAEELFTYPGPNPFTKETAILMMADGVEAASRSLKEYTEKSISDLVEKLIDIQLAEGYFKECPITFKDVAIIKEVFKEKLKTIYHTRISYPELKK